MRSVGTAAILALLLVASAWMQLNNSSATGPAFSATPITDMGTSNSARAKSSASYKGFQGGLYENGSNQVPADHDAVGRKLAAQVTPIDGKIVLLSIGMSNTMDEWGIFLRTYAKEPQVNPSVVVVNGAQGGIGPCAWSVPSGSPHNTCGGNAPNPFDVAKTTRLARAGVTETQVQAVWIKEADAMSIQMPWPPSLPDAKADAYVYEGWIGKMLRAAKQRYPNLKLAFISSRIYGGYNQTSKSHEPYAYENGFSVKWAIEAQIKQADRGGSSDSIAGDLSYSAAPWAAWGPYLWADGDIPRSDGVVWCNGQPRPPCNGDMDFGADALHPNITGQMKVAKMLMNFFLTSPYTTWFKAQSGHSRPH